MKKIILLALLLTGCGASQFNHSSPTSWLIRNNYTNRCYILIHQSIYIDQHITWYDKTRDRTFEIDDFDIAPVKDENFKKAAKLMELDVEKCEVQQ